jgi:hypothetical protein
MNNLSISNFFEVSVAASGPQVGLLNTSNVALFTRETFAASFGTLGYNLYTSPTQVGIDFGTNSQTFAMANAVFSQQPNILLPGGVLIIIPMLTTPQIAVQNINFPAVSASGSFVLNYGGNASAVIEFSATASTIQTDLQALTGLSSVTVAGSIASQNLNVTFTGVSGPATLLTVTSNTLEDSQSAAITPVVSTTTIGSTAETIDAAISRTAGLVAWFVGMIAENTTEAVQLKAAAVVQALTKMFFFVGNQVADIQTGGKLDLLRSGGFTQSRGLYYGDSVMANCLNYMAGYIGRMFSVDFEGSNTTNNAQAKQIQTVQPDPTMTQSIFALAQAAGADIYASFDGVSVVFAAVANIAFDRIYNRLWFANALQVAATNLLLASSTKIPQTENGMSLYKSTLRQVCQQAVVNGFLAPGTWTDPNTFGDLVLFLANISQRGYYLYSQPIGSQSAATRLARQAPLVQIAGKEAGAIDTGAILVNLNP